MTIALITITHGRIGEELTAAATQILGTRDVALRHFVFGPDDDPDRVADGVVAAIGEVDSGSGVLVLCDLYGATPSNIARQVASGRAVRVVCGINLPMVLRALNDSGLDLDAAARRAAEGGRIGVIECGTGDPTG